MKLASSGDEFLVSEFDVVDVASWSHSFEEMLGTKPKRWLLDPDSEVLWLMKYVTLNSRANASVYRKGDDWAERVAGAVASQLELPAAQVELARGGSAEEPELGVISRSIVTEDESLVHGNELLSEIGIGGTDSHDRTGYTLSAVRSVLERVEPAIELPGFSSWETFVGYLVLDALVGNTDRHQENWAVIERGGSRRMAPSFDHASCLGFQLSDEQRSERLASSDYNMSPEAYAARGRSKFEGKPPLMSSAVEALSGLSAQRRDSWLERCEDVEPLVAGIVRVPDGRMSEASKEFAERVLRHNHARLMSHHVGTV